MWWESTRKDLVPIENERQFFEVNADILENIDPIFYGDIRTAVMKCLEMV
jgi:ATP-dependent Lon protease